MIAKISRLCIPVVPGKMRVRNDKEAPYLSAKDIPGKFYGSGGRLKD
jgi:hypothetical protein